MEILYVFQFKEKDKNKLNTIKRRFYYNLRKINKTKIFNKHQIFLVNEDSEKNIDKILNEYLDWLSYYKIKINNINFITK
jgi:hypothetical protein